MGILIIAAITILFYFGASLFIGWQLASRANSGKPWIMLMGFLAVCLHALLLHEWIDITGGQNLNIFNMLSLSFWLMGIFILVIMLIKPIEIISLLIFPLSAVSILLVIAFPRAYVVQTIQTPHTLFHIILSIFTFCILCIAGLLALLLALQEWMLRHHQSKGFIVKIPLESVETFLFQVISLGFILLSTVLLTSIYFYHDLIFDRWEIFLKSILVGMAWIIFAFLLIGRFQFGWRGKKAIYYTLIGVLLLSMAYFGK